MPVTPLSLTTRAGAGVALSHVLLDANWTAIQTAVNALITQIAAKHEDSGAHKTDAIATAAMITNGIITLAKLAVLTGADKGKILRANVSSGAIEAAKLTVTEAADDTEQNPTGAGTDTITTFSIATVPAGSLMVIVNCMAKANAGDNTGTLALYNGATVLDAVALDPIDTAGGWVPFSLTGVIADFAGGTLTLDLKTITSVGSADLTMGQTGDALFGRRLRLLSGL